MNLLLTMNDRIGNINTVVETKHKFHQCINMYLCLSSESILHTLTGRSFIFGSSYTRT